MVGFRWAQCRRVQPVLWEYASERLSEGPMELVEQHLQTCRVCRDEVVTLQRAQRFLSACRACEEPAPRSDWNTLRQRMMAQGVTPISPPAPLAQGLYGQEPKRRAGYASWQMQLLTSTAGGFAAVLMLGAVYTLRPAPRMPRAVPPVSAAARSNEQSHLQATAGKGDAAGTINAPRPAEDQTRLINSVVMALADTRALPDVAASAALPIHALSVMPGKRDQASVKRVLSPRSAFGVVRARSVQGKEHDARIVFNAAPRANGKLRFKPYMPKAQERLQEVASASEGASHYALERVRPVNNESDYAGSYVVGSVRPVSYDESGDY